MILCQWLLQYGAPQVPFGAVRCQKALLPGKWWCGGTMVQCHSETVSVLPVVLFRCSWMTKDNQRGHYGLFCTHLVGYITQWAQVSSSDWLLWFHFTLMSIDTIIITFGHGMLYDNVTHVWSSSDTLMTKELDWLFPWNCQIFYFVILSFSNFSPYCSI